ncbi:zinc-binding dehydrogenase, partial [Pseudomonas amygdali]
MKVSSGWSTSLLNAVAQKLAEGMVLAFDLNNGAEGVEYGGYDRHWAGIQRDKGDIKPLLNTNIPSFYQPRDAQVTWMQFVTAYGALIDIGKLQKGDTVLIRAASSSVGLAAIQIANLIGAVPVALTRTSEKRQALLDAGAAFVIATQEQDLVSEVNSITDGKGARMAFDPVGGAEVANILRSLSFLGIFFQYGALDTGNLSVPVMELLGKDLTIRGYQLFEITEDPARLAGAKEFISKGLQSG